MAVQNIFWTATGVFSTIRAGFVSAANTAQFVTAPLAVAITFSLQPNWEPMEFNQLALLFNLVQGGSALRAGWYVGLDP